MGFVGGGNRGSLCGAFRMLFVRSPETFVSVYVCSACDGVSEKTPYGIVRRRKLFIELEKCD